MCHRYISIQFRLSILYKEGMVCCHLICLGFLCQIDLIVAAAGVCRLTWMWDCRTELTSSCICLELERGPLTYPSSTRTGTVFCPSCILRLSPSVYTLVDDQQVSAVDYLHACFVSLVYKCCCWCSAVVLPRWLAVGTWLSLDSTPTLRLHSRASRTVGYYSSIFSFACSKICLMSRSLSLRSKSESWLWEYPLQSPKENETEKRTLELVMTSDRLTALCGREASVDQITNQTKLDPRISCEMVWQ